MNFAKLLLIALTLTTLSCIYIFSKLKKLGILYYENSPEKGDLEGYEAAYLEETTNRGLSEISTTWESGWSAWNEEQERRKELVRNVCQGDDSQVKSQREKYQDFLLKKRPGLKYLLTCNKYKAIYCFINKVGTNTMMHLWTILQGKFKISNHSDIDNSIVHRGKAKSMGLRYEENKKEEILTKLETYTKVIVVRPPIERLISAYLDKIHYIRGTSSIQKRVLPFVLKQRQNATLKNIQWSEFISFVISSGGRKNEHWMPFDTTCNPCDIDYDVIIKFDTLAEDYERFLRLIKAPEYLHIPQKNTRVTSSILEPYLKNLTSDQMEGINKYFGKDADMFGYDKK